MWTAILYLLAALGALGGAVLSFRFYKFKARRGIWLLPCGAWLLFALLCGLQAYRSFGLAANSPGDLIAGIVALLAVALAVAGIYFIGARSRWLRQFEEQIHQERALYCSIVEHLPNPVGFKDASMTYQAANTSFKDFIGKDKEEIFGRKDADFFPRPLASALLQAGEQALRQGKEQVQEQEVSGKGGKKWLKITHTPVSINGGAISGVLVSGEDITKRKQLEQKIEENKLLIEALSSERQEIQEEKRQAIKKQIDLLRFERLLASIAVHFIDAEAEKIDQGIQGTLRSIGTQTGSDRCRILLFNPGETEMKIAYAWSLPGLAPRREVFSNPPWIGLSQMQVVHVSSRSHVPPEAQNVAEFMQEQDIQTFTAVPLISGRSVNGYLWLESAHQEAHWDDEFLDLLKFAGSVFINALDRMHKDREMTRARESALQRLEILDQRNRENILLNELSDLLQVCRTMEEAYPIIARYTQQLIPVGSGTLYLAGSGEGPVEQVVAWGDAPPSEAELTVNDCWALRRGRAHVVRNSATDLNCSHLRPPLPASYLCTPLIAQGETIGLLHLRLAQTDPLRMAAIDDYQRISEMIAEHTALALSNLSLRDRLRSQAIRDPLTGLFNRRYMEETLEREIRRAVRHSSPVGVVMFDLDHLKQINDTYGHDVGDAVLQEIGNLMAKIFRGEDVPCRYGGDEFTIVLPEATVSEAFRRAEQFRESVKKLEFETDGRRIQPQTISVGIAAYPDHGATVERLLQVADAASYAAKLQGRDRVMIGGEAEE